MSQTQDLSIKGYRGGVLITLPALSCYAQRDLLIRRIQSQERFFKGGRIALDVGETLWNEEQIAKLLRVLSDEGVCLWAILSTSPETLASAASYDIPTSIKRDDNSQLAPEVQMPQEPQITWLENDIEAGENLQIEGSLCLIGDVHPDATLSVDGSILIWGKVAGKISAGEKVCPKNTIQVLQYDGANISLNKQAVDLPGKRKFGLSLRIWQGEDGIKAEFLKEKRFSLL